MSLDWSFLMDDLQQPTFDEIQVMVYWIQFSHNDVSVKENTECVYAFCKWADLMQLVTIDETQVLYRWSHKMQKQQLL